MSEYKSQQNTSTSKTTIHRRQSIEQNFLLIWLDVHIDETIQDYRHHITQFQNIVNDVQIFNQPDECVDFLTDTYDKRTFLIIAGAISQQILPLIHDIPQLDTVYIFCRNKVRYEEWAKLWTKLKGVYTEITSICESLQQDVEQHNQTSIALSFVTANEETSNQDLDQLEPSFMYTQIFKEILLEMTYDRQSIKDFADYCRNNLYGSPSIITRFENEYHQKSAIWWYTYPCFLSSMLNSALRMLEADVIIKMGFFIHDLHRQIEQLYQQQIDSYYRYPFIVYRGQGILKTDFDKLLKTKGGLMSFNSFLSTSKTQDVSFDFAQSALYRIDTVGILFKIYIDPSVSSTPFAAIQSASYFMTEEEILFAMHTVFRIGEIIQLDKNNPIYQVDLQLTSDDDKQLRTLTESIRNEATGPTGWGRLGNLLLKIGCFDKAEELYKVLLEQTSNESEKALYYNQLGYVKADQAEYAEAIRFYERALEIREKTLPSDHPLLATSYNNIAVMYKNMGECEEALRFYEQALEIRQKTLPQNHPDLATSYNNIGLLCQNKGEYMKAFSFYEKALGIYHKSLPPNHPSLASSYDNIGGVYHNMGEYSKALSSHEKALEIRQKTLPSNHPDLATSYNNIAAVYDNMGEYSKALTYYEKALEIQQKTLPMAHPWLAISYNNIGLVYKHMKEYAKAFHYYEKALKIKEKTLPSNHPDLATSYNNIGWVYRSMKNYSDALSYFERALNICQRTLPSNHPNLQNVRKGIEFVKKELENDT